MAGRPPLPIGSHGTIRLDLRPGGLHRARNLFRDADGRTREVSRTGSTKGQARRALAQTLAERSGRTTGGDLSPETTIGQLLDIWWPWRLETGKHLTRSSQLAYEDAMRRIIIPGIGGLRLCEATTGRLDNWLVAERRQRMQVAELSRTILRQAFELAVQRDALTANPAMSVSKTVSPPSEPRPLTLDELTRLRRAVAKTRQPTYLADLVEVQLGLALRIGEALALRVEHFDLESDLPVVHIRSTVVSPSSGPHYLQLYTKGGPAGNRTVVAPEWVVEILRHRARFVGASGFIFTTRDDKPLNARYAQDAFRRERARAGLPKEVVPTRYAPPH